MRYYFLLILVLFAPFFTESQEMFSVQKGEIYRNERKGIVKTFFYKDSQLYSIKVGRNAYELQSFTDGLNYSDSYVDKVDKTSGILGKISLKDDYSIHVDINNIGRYLEISAHRFNYEKGELGEKILLYASSEDEKVLQDFRIDYSQDIRSTFPNSFSQELSTSSVKIIASADSSYLAVHFLKSQGKKSDTKGSNLWTWIQFDENMNKLWEKDVELPFSIGESSIQAILQANNGDIYLVMKTSEEKLIRSKEEDKYEILKIDGKSQEVTHSPIDYPYQHVHSFRFAENKQGEIYLFGGYDDAYDKIKLLQRKTNIPIQGFFSATVSEDLSIQFSQHKIPFEVRSMYQPKKDKKRYVKKGNHDEYKLFYTKLRDVEFNEDGSYVIFLEEYFVVRKEDPRTRIVEYVYNAKNIYGIGVSRAGKTLWTQCIPRHQRAVNDYGGVGYYYTSKGDFSYLVYLDNKKNLELSPEKVPYKTSAADQGKNNVLMMCKINKKTGSMQREIVMQMRGHTHIFIERQFGLFRFFPTENGGFGMDISEGINYVIHKVELK